MLRTRQPLSPVQRRLVRFIAAHQPCTYETIRVHMGYSSRSSAFNQLRGLKALGIVTAPRTRWGNSISRGLSIAKDILVSDEGNFYWVVWMNGFEEEGTNGSPVT